MTSQSNTFWDCCQLDSEQLKCIDQISGLLNPAATNCPSSSAGPRCKSSIATKTESFSHVESAFDDLKSCERLCAAFLRELDCTLCALDNLQKQHSDVCGRSNYLMATCEELLEQQVVCSVIRCNSLVADNNFWAEFNVSDG